MSEHMRSVINSKVRYCQNCLKSPIKSINDRAVLLSPHEFFLHLREYHCTKEGGSFACLYGSNGVCPSLPLDGVSELDYQEHVWRDHLSLSRAEFLNSQILTQTSTNSLSKDPSVVQDQHKWTVYMSQVNLPAVLNDPRLAKRETGFFTKTWGESFDRPVITPSQYIPSITHDHFQQFLLKTSSRRRHFRKHVSVVPTRQQSEISSRMDDCDSIPKIFFNSDFSLLDKETFYQVLPWSCIEKSHSNSKHQSSKLLQEKLSHYLDLVEVQITKQISSKSDAFFEAMVYQNTLQDHLQKTCKSLEFLRNKVRKLDDTLALQPLQVVQKSSLSLKYKQIHEKLKFMVTVQQTQPTIQLLLSTNDYLGALDLISTTQEVLSQELAGIQCFRHLGSQLREMEKLILRMVEDEFVAFTTSFFNQPISDDFKLLPPCDRPISDNCCPLDEERIVLIAMGLYRLDESSFLESLENESCMTVKTFIKQVVIDAITSSEASENDRLTNHIRLLDFERWKKLLERIFYNLVVLLQRVQRVVNIFQLIARKLVDQEDVPKYEAPSRKLDHLNSDNSSFDATVSNVAINSTTALIAASRTSDDTLTLNNTLLTVTDVGAGGERDDVQISNVKKSEYLTELPSCNAEKDVQNSEGSLKLATNSEEKVDEMLKNTANDDDDFDGDDNDNWQINVTQILKDCDPIVSKGKSLKIIGALNEHLCRVCEHAHDRSYKFFTIRVKDGFLDRLSMSEFFELSQCIEWFVCHTERICGKKSSILRGALLNQANKFVNKFHEDKKNKLCLILDNERWKQADVPYEFQDLVNHISLTGQLSLPTKKLNSGGRSQELLNVDREKYAVVGTALMLLKLVVEYCQFADKLPFVAPEILNRLVELLKTFNSRTCQLILGAGALQLVGLKTISTRNLGLASRCLQLMLSYFPLVKSHFHKRLHNKQLNMIKHFEHLQKDYRDHIAEISVKLVSIMDAVLQGILNKYDIKQSSSSPSPMFETLLKQTTRFHEAISSLPKEQVQSILGQFHLNFARNFRNQLNVLNFSRDSTGQSSLVESDLKYYVSGIRSLCGFENFSMSLDDIFC